MTAPNHALTGAFIGLTIANPAVALPLAFLSHFVCDAIPHYDPPGAGAAGRIQTRRFIIEQILIGATICFVIVLTLSVAKPTHWLSAVVCAFLAASPDLLWIPRFIHVRRTGKDVDIEHSNLFWHYHHRLQWKTGPGLWWVEALWFVVFGSFLLAHL